MSNISKKATLQLQKRTLHCKNAHINEAKKFLIYTFEKSKQLLIDKTDSCPNCLGSLSRMTTYANVSIFCTAQGAKVTDTVAEESAMIFCQCKYRIS